MTKKKLFLTWLLLSTFFFIHIPIIYGSSGHKWKKPTSTSSNLVQSDTPRTIAQRGVLNVGLTPGMFPFEMKDNAGSLVGFDIDLANEIAKKMKVSVAFKELQWNDLIPNLLDRNIDIILSSMEVTTQRKKVINFIPYFTSGESVLIRTKDRDKIYQPSDLNQSMYKIAVVSGEISEKVTKTSIPNATVSPLESVNTAILALGNEKVDAMVSGLEINSIAVLKYGNEKFTVLPDLLNQNTIGIGYHKEDTELGIWLSTFVAKFKENGGYKGIEQKWFRDPSWMKRF